MNPFYMYQPVVASAPLPLAASGPAQAPAAQDGPQVFRYVPNYDNPQPVPPAAQPAIQYQYAGQLLIPLNQFAHGAYAYAPFIAPAQAIAPAPASGTSSNPYIYQGATKSQIDAQNAAIAQTNGANQPTMLVPYKAGATQDWWVRELDGTWTLRTTATIQEALQPGYWCYGEGGVPCFVRTEKAK
ncbi:MAG: hypothetical protein M1839_003926 [Geoglossum umbratile]|nr:MAG: hypothetical protein M1839_003926 [Geoglossum umbratile]